jgi:hypothetical protein
LFSARRRALQTLIAKMSLGSSPMTLRRRRENSGKND